MLRALPDDARHASVHAVDPRGICSATDGFRLILRHLHGGDALTALGLYRVYPWVVRNRRRIGRLVPDLPRPPVA